MSKEEEFKQKAIESMIRYLLWKPEFLDELIKSLEEEVVDWPEEKPKQHRWN